jgi:alpha-N-arabinofuranosidase
LETTVSFRNPVIPGFYPDPSVCRVGEDYYLVTSSFEYFFGVPVFHSRDLVHWRQIGHCLTRDSQLPLRQAPASGGIYAPTLRYHAGMFYMTTTNVSGIGNFYVTATDPAGPWSEPILVNMPGIDPSLFFDDEGTVYFTTCGGNQAIIDITTGRRLTEIRQVWSGTGGRFPEAPHLYQINGWYYLLIAEGGTEYGHMVTIARSASPWGPFEGCPHNPILTHRNFGGVQLQGTGHADLVQDHLGQWWMVCLAFRQQADWAQFHHLGRETYLAPIAWDTDGWPVVNITGSIAFEMDVPTLPPHPWEAMPARDEFDTPTLGFVWNYLRNPLYEHYSLSARPGWLRLYGSAVSLHDVDSPTFVGRRQQHFTCLAATLLDFTPVADHEEAGLSVRMNEQHHYEIGVSGVGPARRVCMHRQIGSLHAVVAEQPLADGPVELIVTSDPLSYTFAVRQGDRPPTELAKAETRYLSSEVAGGFTGVYIGLYASGNGQPCRTPADFDWFDYQGE